MLTHSDKAIVALIMAILVILEQQAGLSLGIGEQWVTELLAIISAFLVWLVPNKPA
jgi:hypothetical protein